MEVYLDHAATMPLSDEMTDYLSSILSVYGNPSSQHEQGAKASKIIEDTRIRVADFINADAQDIIFTGGGSASNTLGINGLTGHHDIVYSPTLHKSALKCITAKADAKHIFKLKVGKKGIIDLNDLRYKLQVAYKPLVVVEFANSEIGTIQNIGRIAEITHKADGLLYVDCTGSISTINMDVKKLDIDMCGFSAHKLGGLKGCGILYRKKSVQLSPIIYGSQESGLYGGTENVLGIASLGKAIENYDYNSKIKENRDFMLHKLTGIKDHMLIGAEIDNRLDNNIYISFKGVNGSSLASLLNERGIYVSTGSACNSGETEISPAVLELGVPVEYALGCIRLTFGGDETIEQLEYAYNWIEKYVQMMRDMA